MTKTYTSEVSLARFSSSSGLVILKDDIENGKVLSQVHTNSQICGSNSCPESAEIELGCFTLQVNQVPEAGEQSPH